MTESDFHLQKSLLVAKHEEDIVKLSRSHTKEKKQSVDTIRKQLQQERDLFARKLHAKLQAEHVSKVSLLHHKHDKEVELIRAEAKQTQEQAKKILATAKKEVETGIRRGLERGESAELVLERKRLGKEKEEAVEEIRSKYRRRIREMREGWEEEKADIMTVVQSECDIILRKTKADRRVENSLSINNNNNNNNNNNTSSSRFDSDDNSRVMSIEETDKFISMVLESCRK